MTTTTFTDPTPTDPFKRDQYGGRPLAPHPQTRELRRWTRITTFADALANKEALHAYDEKCIAYGFPRLPYETIAKALGAEDKKDKVLREVVNAAQDLAGAHDGAELGSRIHAATEAIDRHQLTLAQIEPDIAGDVRAYHDTIAAAGITIHEDAHGPWIERFVMLPQIDDGPTVAGVAGTPDRYVWYDGRLYVLDIKTGQSAIRFEMTKTPLQLALYAHGTHWWDPISDTLGEVPRPNFEKAIIAHVPAGSGHCELYFTPINWGWRLCETAKVVRDWRRVDPGELLEQITPIRGGPTLTAVPDNGEQDDGEQDAAENDAMFEARIAWITDRCKTIQHTEPIKTTIKRDDGTNDVYDDPYKALAALWHREHPDIPYFRNGGPTTHQQVDAIAAMCDQIETAAQLPFDAPDPGAPVTTKATVTKAKAEAKAKARDKA